METTFYNVTITVDADNAHAAYALLCKTLGGVEQIDFSTDSFCLGSERRTDEFDTGALSGVVAEDVACFLRDKHGFDALQCEYYAGVVVRNSRFAYLFTPTRAELWTGELLSTPVDGETFPDQVSTLATRFDDDSETIAQHIADTLTNLQPLIASRVGRYYATGPADQPYSEGSPDWNKHVVVSDAAELPEHSTVENAGGQPFPVPYSLLDLIAGPADTTEHKGIEPCEIIEELDADSAEDN